MFFHSLNEAISRVQHLVNENAFRVADKENVEPLHPNEGLESKLEPQTKEVLL